ncbi:hypothetical protein [Teredinibacter turnerae]|uniref:hypothetical protein n=1 Tax=Teredinibacter turnerae TaxID=2426 RepID=UPI0012FB1B87|nr:hypothetical protein [Teredinibacter turnerae]
MPSTVTTSEQFPLDTEESRLKEDVRLRIKAGAIRSWYEKKSDYWVLFTEWNVIGE